MFFCAFFSLFQVPFILPLAREERLHAPVRRVRQGNVADSPSVPVSLNIFHMTACSIFNKSFIACRKFDLYTKSTALPDIEAIKPYYQSLIDKYIPGELEW